MSSVQENGTLYFIQPEQEFVNKKANCKLYYDLTVLTKNDTVSLNYTFYDTEIREIDSISLFEEKRTLTSKTDKMYIESDKNLWEHRYSAKFLFQDINLFFKENERIEILIHHSGGRTTKLYPKNKKSEEQSEVVSKILNLIDSNR